MPKWTRESLLRSLTEEERQDIGADNLKLAIRVCNPYELAKRFPHIKDQLDAIKDIRNSRSKSVYGRYQEGSAGDMFASFPPEVFEMLVAACPEVDHNRLLMHKFLQAWPEYRV